MAFDKECTLYLYHQNGQWKRHPLRGVHWQATARIAFVRPGLGGGVRVREGNVDSGGVKVWVPLPLVDLPLALEQQAHVNYLAQGILEEELCENTLREFLENNRIYTVTSVEKHDYGSWKLRHWQIEAR